MQAMHADRPDLLLVDAQAFLLADGIYHEPALNQLGQRTLVAALGKQGRDGAFAGRGGPTIANQARALESLVEIALYFPAPSLNEAAASAARWLARKIASKQHSGPAERADALSPSAAIEWRDGILALSYQASRVGDSKALASTIAWMGPSGR